MSAHLSSVIRQLGYVVLEREGGGAFSVLSEAPDWFAKLFPIFDSKRKTASMSQVSPFLDNFLIDAAAFWEREEAGTCESGTWIEKEKSGRKIPIEAKALQLDGRQLLLIHSPGPKFTEQVGILQRARSAALEHEKLVSEIQKKEILLHCIVHDLSQPLSAMRGSFDCLAMENDAERIAKYIELGKHASQQQENMIREILHAFSADLHASPEADKSPDAAPDLLAAARNAAETLAPAFEAKSVQLSFNEKLVANRSWRVQGEETRLFRVFANLLENALRYTPERAKVTIGIEDDGGYFKAYIDDEGPGLPDELRPAQIFGLFTKGKESGGKEGLGLYFCRIAVERWGGSIGCASLPVKGSRFWFRLPRALTTEYTGPPGIRKISMIDTNEDQMEKQRGLHILLADDQEDIRTLTTRQLERYGHVVITVSNGEAALETVRSRHFDVILLDEEMPLKNGVQAAQDIRETQKNQEKRSLLVALTGNDTPEDKARLISAGFDWVLGKPFRFGALEKFLRDPKQKAAPEPPAEKSAAKAIAGLEDLLQWVGGDDKLLRQMIRTFLRETPKRLETIQKAVQRRDGAEVSSRAHALKGSVSIFGAAKAAQRTQSLQDLGRISDFREAERELLLLQEEIAKLKENLRGYAKVSLAGASSATKQETRRKKKLLRRKR
jgi:signal transduction histidine kinase/CheY-like chemotaxis protein